MGPDDYSDYGSGSSTNSGRSWHSQEPWPQFKSGLERRRTSSSFLDLVMNQCTLDDALEEFRLNGSDSPYNPEEERWSYQGGTTHADQLIGMGPSSQYLRQKSWPQPEVTPAVQLPRNQEWSTSLEQDFRPSVQPAEVPVEVSSPQYEINQPEAISQEQLRVLSSLPNDVLYALLRGLEGQGVEKKPKRRMNEMQQECRFCKNNGERESYYRSHSLKAGGRVACPVLRAFVCRRCGASGDAAHTAKYCPMATLEERKKSAAMMRSVRLSAARRRAASPELVRFGAAPLHPLWAALEQKLML
ncbi:uncharacterized protein LOC128669898 isoform X2 [Plodia interpunctella]|uniref:uncharacterized protein LOC128669898 isoform X2 n=1 Tax=Plodia interpunctella TaxID=58824 RepID=UPI002368998D|nr:uncharacterized protein LOC128669898 isoform X2 [Plodia interpunctella]